MLNTIPVDLSSNRLLPQIISINVLISLRQPSTKHNIDVGKGILYFGHFNLSLFGRIYDNNESCPFTEYR